MSSGLKHSRDERALQREEEAREQKPLTDRSEQERLKADREQARAETEERDLELRIRLAELNSERVFWHKTDGDRETTGQAKVATPQS